VIAETAAEDDRARLSRLAEIAFELGNGDIEAQAQSLGERVAEGRFYVACLGQFKRGKSTLLNALVNATVLPVGVVPVTAVVTSVRYGAELRARVRVGAEDWREVAPASLDEYVAEAKNPENAKNVEGVEVFVPSELLRSGMCLVDTPGVGSVFVGNTEATRDFVPHIDAALVVIGADPPLAKSELDLISEVAKDVDRILFVVAKSDRLSATEIAEGKAFANEVLTKHLGREPGPILEVSAHERIKSGGATRDWSALEARLVSLGDEGRVALVRASARRGVMRLGQMLGREIDEQRAALLRPQDESQRRIAALRAAVADAEQALAEMAYLFTAVQDQLSTRFEKDRLLFVAREEPVALRELGARIRADAESGAKDLATRAMEHARSIGHAHVEKWRAANAPVAEQLYEEAGQRFVDLANDFLKRVAASGEAALSALPETFEAETRFRTKPKFYFHEHLTIGSPSVAGRLTSLMLGKAKRLASVEHEAGAYLKRLFETNSNRSANDFADQVRESRSRLQADLRKHLQSVVAAADRCLVRATETIAAGADAVDREVARLDHLRAEVNAMVAT
jgi:hypothetical protein